VPAHRALPLGAEARDRAWERRLRTSVCQTTRTHCSSSKARASSNSLASVLMPLRQWADPSQVKPIATVRGVSSMSY
jgi:hypothetical protein